MNSIIKVIFNLGNKKVNSNEAILGMVLFFIIIGLLILIVLKVFYLIIISKNRKSLKNEIYGIKIDDPLGIKILNKYLNNYNKNRNYEFCWVIVFLIFILINLYLIIRNITDGFIIISIIEIVVIWFELSYDKQNLTFDEKEYLNVLFGKVTIIENRFPIIIKEFCNEYYCFIKVNNELVKINNDNEVMEVFGVISDSNGENKLYYIKSEYKEIDFYMYKLITIENEGYIKN